MQEKLKYAGGYNGDRYSVAGYLIGDDNYFIKSVNSITAKVMRCIDKGCESYQKPFNVSIFRNDEFVFSYDYILASNNINRHAFSLVDDLAINILFQLDEVELDTLLPMIKDSKEHSFSFDSNINKYYIYCETEEPAINEFIIHKFNNKFYFDECSLYRKNSSVHVIIRDYSDFSYISLSHSLSDEDSIFNLSGYYSAWCMVFDSKMNTINYIIDKKNPVTMKDIKEVNTIKVKNIDDFYDTIFGMVFNHILSDDYMVNIMSNVVNSYDLDINQNWKTFLHLFDMVTI